MLAAARWAIYVERMMPVLRDLEAIQNTDLAGLTGDARHRVGLAKVQVATNIPIIRGLLDLDG